jgi:tRNA G37 N-methylase TrmD
LGKEEEEDDEEERGCSGEERSAASREGGRELCGAMEGREDVRDGATASEVFTGGEKLPCGSVNATALAEASQRAQPPHTRTSSSARQASFHTPTL